MNKLNKALFTLLINPCTSRQIICVVEFFKRNAEIRLEIAYLLFKRSYELRDVRLGMSAKAFESAVILTAPAFRDKARKRVIQNSFKNMTYGVCSAESRRDLAEMVANLNGESMTWLMWYRLCQGLCTVGAFEAALIARKRSIRQVKSGDIGIDADESFVLARIRAHLEDLELDLAVQVLNENRQVINISRLNKLEKFISVLYRESADDMELQIDSRGEVKLASLISRKRIAVVGPSDSSEINGIEIDAHDTVLRVRPFGGKDFHVKKICGCRSNIVCANSQKDFDFILKEINLDVVYLTNEIVVASDSVLTFQSSFGQTFPFGDTVTGLRAILTVLAFRPKSLKVFHFDFYSKKQLRNSRLEKFYEENLELFSSKYLAAESKLKDNNMDGVHDFFANFQLAKNLFALNLIDGTSEVKNILLNSLEEYAVILERRLFSNFSLEINDDELCS